MDTQSKLAQQITGFIFLAIILYVVFLFMGGGKKDTKKIEQTKQETQKEKYVTVSGIDKDKQSKLYGTLQLEEINVWSWDDAKNERERIVGVLPHGTRVKVLEEKTTDQKYYKVTTDTLFYEGWISEQMVEE
jgi:hypothetical protein